MCQCKGMMILHKTYYNAYLFRMSSNKYYKSSMKEEIVICRVETCQRPLKKQNYSRHLKTVHKEENSNDLRVYGQAKFSWNP